MYNHISDIPIWYAEYLETISQLPIEQLHISDVNAIWELLNN